jgi:hypothetical protein
MARPDPLSAAAVSVETVDRQRLARLRRIGDLLDNVIGIPGTPFRIGLDGLIGLVPGVGDLIGGLLSLYIIQQAAQLGAPSPVLLRMGWNVAVDTLVGEIPLLGDLFDFGWKANLKNVDLLQRHLDRPSEARRSGRLFLFALGTGLVLLLAGAVALTAVLLHAAGRVIR